MKPKQTPHTPSKPIPSDASDREYWVERIHELPEVRIDKVRATREALENNAYETEQKLDDTVDRITADLGQLRDPELDPPDIL